MKNNKFLVIGIISTLVVCLVGIMVFLIIEISEFTEQPQLVERIATAPTPTPEVTIKANLNFNGLIQDLSEETLFAVNIENGEPIELNFVADTNILDKYGKVIPLSQIPLGEIVDVEYALDSHDILSLQIHPMSFLHQNITSEQIKDDIVQIGTKKLFLDELLLIQNPLGEILPDLSSLNEFDEMLIKGFEDQVYSISIVEGSGYIELLNLPTENGRLEINRQKQLSLNNIKNNTVEVQSGIYHIVLYLEDYLPIIIDDAVIGYGQTYAIDASMAQPILYDVTINIVNNDQPYNISVNDVSYGEEKHLELAKGLYNLDITSAGFYDYSHEFKVKNDMSFQFILSPIPPPPLPAPIIEVPAPPLQPVIPESELLLEVEPIPNPTLNNTEQSLGELNEIAQELANTTPLSEPDITDIIPPIEPELALEPATEVEMETEKALEYKHIINLNTSPNGASVYLDGIYLGLTPVSKNLDKGIYKVEFSLEGYEKYSTSIIVEEDLQTDYLYVLIPK